MKKMLSFALAFILCLAMTAAGLGEGEQSDLAMCRKRACW